jgi:TonB family protein
LLDARPIGPSALTFGLVATLGAHVLIPLAILGSQWLLVVLGLAVPVQERERPREIVEITEAELVRLGKPFDPRKLPSRKVPPVAKAPPDAVAVSRDAKPPPEKPPEEKKERPKEAKAAALDNLIDRTKEFAEDVEYEQEGDPEGLREGTATKKGEGDLYAGQLSLFFRRNWSVPNVVQNPDRLVAEVFVEVASDGRVTDVQIAKASGDVYFDQSLLDAIEPLVKERAAIPEPPPELQATYYGKTLKLRFKGTDAR